MLRKKLSLKKRFERFRAILSLYYKHRPKLLLCLKLHYRIPLTPEDIDLWNPKCSSSDRNILLENFGLNFDGKDDVEIYKIIPLLLTKMKRNQTLSMPCGNGRILKSAKLSSY